MLPDLLVFIIPIVSGIALLIIAFSWLLLLMLVVLSLLSLGGNALIRGRFACKYCRQREVGCPAERLFEKREGAET